MVRFFLFLALCVMSATSQAQNVAAPDEVKNGDAIRFTVPDAIEGDTFTWILLQPSDVTPIQYESNDGTEFVVDPPVGYAGRVKVLCLIINWEKHTSVKSEHVTLVAKLDLAELCPDKPVPVDPVPVDPVPVDPVPVDPVPVPVVDEYDGPNQFGVGQVSYDSSPAYSGDAVTIFKEAASALYATGGQQRVINDYTDAERNKTDYNVFVWIRNQMSEKGLTSPEWVAWYNACYSQWKQANADASGGLLLTQWYDLFNEVAAGNEARKK